jgi:hypothetical protein
MQYELVPLSGGTEGRIREFHVVGYPYILSVNRKTYTYAKDLDGLFQRLSEEWEWGGINFDSIVDAMSSALDWLDSMFGLFLEGDTIFCDLEGVHYEWTLRNDGTFDFQKNSLESVEKI